MQPQTKLIARQVGAIIKEEERKDQEKKAGIKTLSGNVMLPNFNPKLIADFPTIWQTQFHKKWYPVYANDLKLNQAYDFIKTIVTRVKRFNESYDMTIVGDRGLGKSAIGLGLAKLINSEFKGDPYAKYNLDNVCFDVDSWIALTDDLSGSGGGVTILDEVGTEGSLSSRTSMSKGNRATSDIIQLCRTDRIITIYISTDRDRIDKRVRELTSVMATPIAKLSDEDTNGYGLAIEADVRYRRTRPSGDHAHNSHHESDSGYLVHEVSPLHYAPKGRIYSVVVPHAPVDLWKGYEAKRAQKLADVRDAGFVAYDSTEDAEEMMKNKKESAKAKVKAKKQSPK